MRECGKAFDNNRRLVQCIMECNKSAPLPQAYVHLPMDKFAQEIISLHLDLHLPKCNCKCHFYVCELECLLLSKTRNFLHRHCRLIKIILTLKQSIPQEFLLVFYGRRRKMYGADEQVGFKIGHLFVWEGYEPRVTLNSKTLIHCGQFSCVRLRTNRSRKG